MDLTEKSVKVFCCYAREDQVYLHELRKHLSPLEREGRITLWADVDISAGTEWEREIECHLNAAHIILKKLLPSESRRMVKLLHLQSA